MENENRLVNNLQKKLKISNYISFYMKYFLHTKKYELFNQVESLSDSICTRNKTFMQHTV